MDKNKVLILGGNGFIGSNLGQVLTEQGYNVTSFDREFPKEMLENVRYLKGDFFDELTLEELIKSQDIVYHAISTINPGNSNAEYMQGYQKDLIQTIRLCELIEKYRIKLIFLSSGGTVYGNQSCQPIPETALPCPINHYGNLKLCMENTMRIFHMQKKCNVRIARISNPYGPGQDYKKGVGFIDAVIKKAVSGETIEIWGDGSVVRDYIYIDDVCDMLAFLAQYEGEESTFNIGSGVGTSQNGVIRIIQKFQPDILVKYMESRSVDVKSAVLDCRKIQGLHQRNVLGVEEGISRYYYWCRENNAY